jgi:septation ring formation regulator EzrA
MLALATTAALLATVPLDSQRFDKAKVQEAQREVLATYESGLEAVNGYYHWATHSVRLDRYLAQQKAVDIGNQVQASEAAFSRVTGLLEARTLDGIQGEVTAVRDALTKVNHSLSKLRGESGAAAPNRSEVRFLTAELFRSLTTAQEAQMSIGKKLGITRDDRTGDRAR